MRGWALILRPAASAALSIMRAKPALENGAPRSDTKDLEASFCDDCHTRAGWTLLRVTSPDLGKYFVALGLLSMSKALIVSACVLVLICWFALVTAASAGGSG